MSEYGRGISEKFIEDLTAGCLSSVLELVKRDDTLCLQIRKDKVNIYYRGGNVLSLTDKGNYYIPDFDENYLEDKTKKNILELPDKIQGKEDAIKWVNAIHLLKHGMDIGRKLKDEREFQQLIVRENNSGKYSVGTDYYICDIEYANKEAGRFDMIAVQWPSTRGDRKINTELRLALVEVKYGEAALSGESGMVDHVRKAENFLMDTKKWINLRQEMQILFNQLRKLGLVTSRKDIENISTDIPEFIFVLANQDPDSSKLKEELVKLEKYLQEEPKKKIDIKFAVGNFMGYGLYQQSIYSLRDFVDNFAKHIYSR